MQERGLHGRVFFKARHQNNRAADNDMANEKDSAGFLRKNPDRGRLFEAVSEGPISGSSLNGASIRVMDTTRSPASAAPKKQSFSEKTTFSPRTTGSTNIASRTPPYQDLERPLGEHDYAQFRQLQAIQEEICSYIPEDLDVDDIDEYAERARRAADAVKARHISSKIREIMTTPTGCFATELSSPTKTTFGFAPRLVSGNSTAATTGSRSFANRAPSFQPPMFSATALGNGFQSRFGKLVPRVAETKIPEFVILTTESRVWNAREKRKDKDAGDSTKREDQVVLGGYQEFRYGFELGYEQSNAPNYKVVDQSRNQFSQAPAFVSKAPEARIESSGTATGAFRNRTASAALPMRCDPGPPPLKIRRPNETEASTIAGSGKPDKENTDQADVRDRKKKAKPRGMTGNGGWKGPRGPDWTQEEKELLVQVRLASSVRKGVWQRAVDQNIFPGRTRTTLKKRYSLIISGQDDGWNKHKGNPLEATNGVKFADGKSPTDKEVTESDENECGEAKGRRMDMG